MNAINIPVQLKACVAIDYKNHKLLVDVTQVRRADVQTFINNTRGLTDTPLIVEPVDFTKIRSDRSSYSRESDLQPNSEYNRMAIIDIIHQGAQYGVSDIHLVVGEDHTAIQFELDGRLRQLPSCSRNRGAALIKSVYQALASVSDSSYLLSQYQTASVSGSVFKNEYGISGVRVQRGPCYPYDKEGEFMTMRIHYSQSHRIKSEKQTCPFPIPNPPEGVRSFGQLGFDARQVELLNRLMCCPDGAVIVTGPVGSGKSTTLLQLILNKLNQFPYCRLITIEDPVEIAIPGTVQFSVQNVVNEVERGEAYSRAMTVMLRMAPKWMYFGEIRDECVASVVLEAAVSGHGIYTTMHVSDPHQWVDRLMSLNRSGLIDRRNVCDSKKVRGIIGQRMLSKLCSNCSVDADSVVLKYQNLNVLLSDLATWGDISGIKFQGGGCGYCGGAGVVDRILIAEVIITDEVLMDLYMNQGAQQARDFYHRSIKSDTSLLDKAIKLVLNGQVDAYEVMERVDTIRPKQSFLV